MSTAGQLFSAIPLSTPLHPSILVPASYPLLPVPDSPCRLIEDLAQFSRKPSPAPRSQTSTPGTEGLLSAAESEGTRDAGEEVRAA